MLWPKVVAWFLNGFEATLFRRELEQASSSELEAQLCSALEEVEAHERVNYDAEV